VAIAFTLQDSSLGKWDVSVTDAGVLQTTGASVNPATTVFLDDPTFTTSWQLGVTTLGLLTTTAVAAGGYPSFFQALSSTGISTWRIGVTLLGNLTTSSLALACQGTYKFQDVVTETQELVHQIPTTVVQLYACDKVNSIVHLYWPWHWTSFGVPPIVAKNGVQDYPFIPGDFYKLLAGRIFRTDISPYQIQPIKIAGHLEGEVQRQGSINTIQSVSYEPVVNSFRLDIPLQVSGGTVYLINLDYQNKPIKVTALTQTICPPDQYYNVLVEGVLWAFYRLADDPRAGTVTINRAGDKQYSGQLSVFMDALETMKRMEDSGQALDTRYPEEPLGWVRTGNPGIFPTT
jgi:hypothetical protein